MQSWAILCLKTFVSLKTHCLDGFTDIAIAYGICPLRVQHTTGQEAPLLSFDPNPFHAALDLLRERKGYAEYVALVKARAEELFPPEPYNDPDYNRMQRWTMLRDEDREMLLRIENGLFSLPLLATARPAIRRLVRQSCPFSF